MGIMPCTLATSSSVPWSCSNFFHASRRATRYARMFRVSVVEIECSQSMPYLAIEFFALEVFIPSSEHISGQVGIAINNLHFGFFIFVLFFSQSSRNGY